MKWAKDNLFNTPWNSFLTIATVLLLGYATVGSIYWLLYTANVKVVSENFRLLMVGPYPQEVLWRLWVGTGLIHVLAGFQWGLSWQGKPLDVATRRNISISAVLILAYSIWQWGAPSALGVPALGLAVWVGFMLGKSLNIKLTTVHTFVLWLVLFFVFLYFVGGNLGSGGISTDLWGGLLLTMLLSVVSIVASFPIGVALAIGRRSPLPVISGFCVVLIEVVRGVPLVAVLFMAQLFIPLFVPEDLRIDKVLRAMIGMTIFSAAYLAEYVRGGLQAVPKGQEEAARALGLNGTQTLMLIVLPQALRAVIPAIVGQFIGLFKDTSLVAIIGLTDLLGAAKSITANPNWIGTDKEMYIAVALIYLVFTTAMAAASRRIETRLSAGR